VSKVLIIIPAYNEEKSIGNVLDGILQLRDSMSDPDILVMDDGSKDATARVALSKHVNVIKHAENHGEEGAIQTGFDYAMRHNYDYVVKLDADGQHEPSEISKILDPLLKNEADVIIGSRLEDYPEPLLFRIGRLFCSSLVSVLIRKRISDPTSGFKARSLRAVKYSRALYLATEFLHNDLVNDIEELILYSKKKMRIKEVPINMNKREYASKIYASRRLLEFPFIFFLAISKSFFASGKTKRFL